MKEQREGNNNLGNKKINSWYTCISVKNLEDHSVFVILWVSFNIISPFNIIM